MGVAQDNDLSFLGNERSPKPDSELFTKGMRNLPSALGKMKFSNLREGQDRIVTTIMSGIDCLCVMPTAGGKTACYIVPALAQDWRLLVFSPLKALMRDQTKALQKKGIVALDIQSDNTDNQNQSNLNDWVNGECKILYVAPERLANANFKEALKLAPPDMITLDEMHVLSQWKDNFRHAYAQLGELVHRFRPRVVTGFTATCTDEVEEEVRKVLQVPNALKITHYPPRENLILSSSSIDKEDDLERRLDSIDGSCLVYCSSRKKTEELAKQLYYSLNEEVGYFHSQVNNNVKKETQDRFLDNKVRVMVATNAFGMGVDKPDIRAVFHYHHPSDLDALAQEIGRAGRDGEKSWCHTYQSKQAEFIQRRNVENSYPPREVIERLYKWMKNAASKGDNVFEASGRKISADLKINDYMLASLIELFYGNNIIEQVKDYQIHRVKIIDRDLDVKNFNDILSSLDKLADLDPQRNDGSLVFTPENVAEDLGKSPVTLRKYLNQYSREGFIFYEPPSRTKPKRLIGDLSNIDFKNMAIKRERAFKKLDCMIDYFSVPDEEKSEYLMDYFNKFE